MHKTYYKKLMKLASLAGKILLESNAEEYRVEDTTYRILAACDLDSPASYSNTTGLFLSLTDSIETDWHLSNMVRINHRTSDIQAIAAVNDVSRRFVAGHLSVDEAYQQLKDIPKNRYQKTVSYSNIILMLAVALLLGGNLSDLLLLTLTGLLIAGLDRIKQTIYFTPFSYPLFVMTLATSLILILDGVFPYRFHHNLLLAAILIPFYPGTSITNAMRDFLRGNNLAGIIKAIDALMVILAIAIGISIGILFTRTLFNLF